MEIFAVGGAVRDELLGRPSQDRDYVVVGATPEDMVARGFMPVGRDFPVFLHPETHEEYALARTERKSGRGYKGFTVFSSPDVTLEEDLARRDLTINAMARAAGGQLIDPYGGHHDLAAGVLRHVSPAFVEDPLRVLRVARFAARFGFIVAPETLALMREIAAAGELEHLTPERVWQELARGLMEAEPARMFEVLRQAKALPVILPELEAAYTLPARTLHPLAQDDRSAGNAAQIALAATVEAVAPLPVRYAALVGAIAQTPAVADAIAERWRIPNDCQQLAALTVVLVHAAFSGRPPTPADWLDLLHRADVFRRPEQLAGAAAAAEAIAHGAHLPRAQAKALLEQLRAAARAARAVDAGAIAATRPPSIPEAIRAARQAAITTALGEPATKL